MFGRDELDGGTAACRCAAVVLKMITTTPATTTNANDGNSSLPVRALIVASDHAWLRAALPPHDLLRIGEVYPHRAAVIRV